MNICTAIGDCGADINYIGVFVDEGYELDRRGSRTGEVKKSATPGGTPTFGGPSSTQASGNVIQGLVVRTYNQLSGADDR